MTKQQLQEIKKHYLECCDLGVWEDVEVNYKQLEAVVEDFTDFIFNPTTNALAPKE